MHGGSIRSLMIWWGQWCALGSNTPLDSPWGRSAVLSGRWVFYLFDFFDFCSHWCHPRHFAVQVSLHDHSWEIHEVRVGASTKKVFPHHIKSRVSVVPTMWKSCSYSGDLKALLNSRMVISFPNWKRNSRPMLGKEVAQYRSLVHIWFPKNILVEWIGTWLVNCYWPCFSQVAKAVNKTAAELASWSLKWAMQGIMPDTGFAGERMTGHRMEMALKPMANGWRFLGWKLFCFPLYASPFYTYIHIYKYRCTCIDIKLYTFKPTYLINIHCLSLIYI